MSIRQQELTLRNCSIYGFTCTETLEGYVFTVTVNTSLDGQELPRNTLLKQLRHLQDCREGDQLNLTLKLIAKDVNRSELLNIRPELSDEEESSDE